MVKGGNINKALILYAINGQIEDARRVIQKGAKVDTTDLDSRTALIHAAYRGYADIVDLLLQQGADTSIRDCDGHTAQEYAIDQGHAKIAALLASAPVPKKQQPPPPLRSVAKPYDIDRIMALPSDAEFVMTLHREIEKKLGREEWQQDYAEGNFYAAYLTDRSIRFDGLHGYFMNAAALPLREGYAAFLAVGAHRRAELLKFAMGIFPDSEPPEDQSYMELVENLTPEQKQGFDNLEAHYYALDNNDTPEDLHKLLRAYVQQNIQDFR